MVERLDGKPKKKGGWMLPQFQLIIEPKKEKNEAEAYENEKICAMKAHKDKQTLRRL
jgi:hypothetical protein